MKKKSIVILCLMVIIAVALNYVAFFGYNIAGHRYGGMFDEETGIKKGIDIAGGSTLTFKAEKENPTEEEMSRVKSVFDERLEQAGYSEARTSLSEADKITVEMPATKDPNEAAEILGSTATLTFTDCDGNVLLEGSDIKEASYQYGRPTENASVQHYIQLSFKPEAVSKFTEATIAASQREYGKNYIAIMLDDKQLSAPMVTEPITQDTCSISGSFKTAEETQGIVAMINSGNMPFALKKISQSTIGAELGSNALPTSLLAAGIGIILVMIFMIVMYRLPGLVADLALAIYIGIMCLILGFAHINLSLSGIAGIVLSIGMAVDANVIIFERMKEELKQGKTIKAGVEAGFAKAFSAIFDSNITTIITCIVLYLSGIGTITGFALTLGIGVAVSMFTAIVVTKFLLKHVIRLNISNRKLFCA